MMADMCQDANTFVGLYIHVGEVLHMQEHLCLNMWNLYPLQSSMENRAISQLHHFMSVCLCMCMCVVVWVYLQRLKMSQVVEVAGVNV